jgi:ATP-dependent DNA ligase
LFEKISELGCEGIVSKRIDAPYTSGPSKTWLKCQQAETGVYPVIGYVPDGKRIEAVLIAEKKGRELRPVGRVEFWARGVMTPDAQKALAFLTRSKDRGACYVEPRLMAKLRHFGRIGDGYLRARCWRASASRIRGALFRLHEAGGPRQSADRAEAQTAIVLLFCDLELISGLASSGSS